MASIKIYQSILFGNLRPWLDKNQSADFYSSKITPALKSETGLTNQYFTAICQIFPELSGEDEVNNTEEIVKEEGISDNHTQITTPLIHYELPVAYNPKTEFYYYLIKNEGTRFINFIHNAITSSQTGNIARSLVNEALDLLKYYLSECGVQYQYIETDENLPFPNNDDSNTLIAKEDSRYILNILQWTLVRLFLEIQELHGSLLDSQLLSEEDIYKIYIGKDQPQIKYARRINVLDNFLIKRFLTQYPYTLKMALDRLDFSKSEFLLCKNTPSSYEESKNRNEAMLSHIMILENLIFLHEFVGITDNPSFEELATPEYTENAYRECTTQLQSSIEHLTASTRKLELIELEMQKFSFLKSPHNIDESSLRLSLPRKVMQWLNIQKTFFEANLHIDPSRLLKLEVQKIITDLTVSQLAYLFNAMVEAKIIKTNNNEDLYRTIASTFSSLKKEDISVASIKNKFLSPEGSSVDFWMTGFSKLLRIAQKKQQDLSE